MWFVFGDAPRELLIPVERAPDGGSCPKHQGDMELPFGVDTWRGVINVRADRTWRKRVLAWLMCVVCLTTTVYGSSDGDSSTDSSGAINLNSPDAVIAVEVGTTTESDARSAYPDAQIIYVNSATDGLLNVTSGKG